MAKYIIQKSIKECDFWYADGKIHVSTDCTQKELEVLYNYKVDGVLKLEETAEEGETKPKKNK